VKLPSEPPPVWTQVKGATPTSRAACCRGAAPRWRAGCYGAAALLVLDLDQGRIRLSHRAAEFMNPASVTKLVTTAAALELLRVELGGTPLHVNSGYRCPAYNKRIGGAPKSQHMEGKAADLSGRKVIPGAIANQAEDVPAFRSGGIGRYPTFTHVDLRTGGPARW
jgi:hypothetical protein